MNSLVSRQREKWCIRALVTLALGVGSPVHAENLNAALSSADADQNLVLTEDSTGNGIFISGRTVTISGGDDRHFIAPSGSDPLFVVGEGGHLVLSDFQIEALTDGALVDQALLFVDGGRLEVSNCSIDAAWRFAIYVRSGSLTLRDCAIFGSEYGVTATDGGTVTIERAKLAGLTSSAVSVRGTGTNLDITNSQITQARQGLTASDGAAVTVKDVAFASFDDAALFLDGATASLDGVSMEEIPNVGLYAAGNTTLDMRGGHALGPTKTAINLQQVSTASIFGYTIEDAELGIYSASGSGDVALVDMRFLTENPAHSHVIANARSTLVTTSWFIGGKAGVVWDSGETLAIDSSIFANQVEAAIRTRDIGETETGLSVADITVFSGDVARAIDDRRGSAMIENSIFFHIGEAIYLGANASPGEARLNSFLGAQELSIASATDIAPSVFLNATIEPSVLPELWDKTHAVVFGDTPAEQMIDKLDGLIPEIQSEFIARETDYGVSSLALDVPDFRPASKVGLGTLERMTGDDPAQFLGELQAGDFPLEILPGTYRLQTDAGPEEFTVFANKEHRIAYRRPEGPFAIALENGGLVSGPVLRFLDQDRIRDFVAKRWPAHGRYSVGGVPRHGVSAEARTASLAYATQNIADITGKLAKLPDYAEWNDLTEEQKESLNAAQYGAMPQLLDIMRAVGTAADAATLFDRYRDLRDKPIKAFVARRFLATAIDIWLRLGLLSDSPAARELASLDADPEKPHRLVLATALGRVGHAAAIQLLVEEIAVNRNGERLHSYEAVDAFDIISAVPDPAVTALSLDIVTAFDAYGRARLRGEDGVPNFEGLPVAAVFSFAYMHAAAYATGEDRTRLHIAVAPWDMMFSIAPMFENPEVLLDNMLGNIIDAKYDYNINVLSSPICRIHIGRSPAESETISIAAREALRAYMVRNEFERPDSFSSDVEALGRARCSPEQETMQYLKRPENSDPDLLPTHMRYAFRSARDFLPDFATYPDTNISASLFDAMPDARFEPLAADEVLNSKPGFERYLNYRAVTRNADLVYAERFSGLDDERLLLEPVVKPDNDNPRFWVSAKVSLSPRVSNGKAFFGIGLQTAFRDDNGLASLIAQYSEAVDRMTGNFNREMIKAVRLRHGETETDLQFLQTTANGTHVFGLPEGPVSDANLIVDVHMRTLAHDGTETHQRIVSFPLYDSPFGYDRMRREGRILLQ